MNSEVDVVIRERLREVISLNLLRLPASLYVKDKDGSTLRSQLIKISNQAYQRSNRVRFASDIDLLVLPEYTNKRVRERESEGNLELVENVNAECGAVDRNLPNDLRPEIGHEI